MPYDLKNSDLADVWLSAPPQDRESVLYDFVESTIRDSTCDKKKIKQSIRFFHCKMLRHWNESKHRKQQFKKKHSKWLSWRFYNPKNVSIKIIN